VEQARGPNLARIGSQSVDSPAYGRLLLFISAHRHSHPLFSSTMMQRSCTALIGDSDKAIWRNRNVDTPLLIISPFLIVGFFLSTLPRGVWHDSP
jgi:hypothetical protein